MDFCCHKNLEQLASFPYLWWRYNSVSRLSPYSGGIGSMTSGPSKLIFFPSLKKTFNHSSVQCMYFLAQNTCAFLWCNFSIGVRLILRYLWNLLDCMRQWTVDLEVRNAKVLVISGIDFFWVETARKISLSCRWDVFLSFLFPNAFLQQNLYFSTKFHKF